MNITLRSALQTTFQFARIFYLHAPANKYAISINISFVNSFLYRFLQIRMQLSEYQRSVLPSCWLLTPSRTSRLWKRKHRSTLHPNSTNALTIMEALVHPHNIPMHPIQIPTVLPPGVLHLISPKYHTDVPTHFLWYD